MIGIAIIPGMTLTNCLPTALVKQLPNAQAVKPVAALVGIEMPKAAADKLVGAKPKNLWKLAGKASDHSA